MSPTCGDAGRGCCLTWGVEVVTSGTSPQPVARVRRPAPWRDRLMLNSIFWLLCLSTGCSSNGFSLPWKKSEPQVLPPQGTAFLTAREWEREVVPPEIAQERDAAKALFDEKKYAEAEPLFHALAQATPTSWLGLGLFTTSESDESTR